MRNHNSSDDFLFHEGAWFATSSEWRKKLLQEIEKIDGNELLNSSTSDLATYYATKFSLSVPVLYADDITVNQKEVQIYVSNDKGRYFSHNSGPYYIAGTCIEVEVPFSGDAIGFKIQPTTQNYNNPRASIGDSTLHFSISGVNLTSEYVKSGIEKKLPPSMNIFNGLNVMLKTTTKG